MLDSGMPCHSAEQGRLFCVATNLRRREIEKDMMDVVAWHGCGDAIDVGHGLSLRSWETPRRVPSFTPRRVTGSHHRERRHSKENPCVARGRSPSISPPTALRLPARQQDSHDCSSKGRLLAVPALVDESDTQFVLSEQSGGVSRTLGSLFLKLELRYLTTRAPERVLHYCRLVEYRLYHRNLHGASAFAWCGDVCSNGAMLSFALLSLVGPTSSSSAVIINPTLA